MNYILAFILMAIGLGKFSVAVYFLMIKKKGNGLRFAMISCNAAGALLFLGAGFVSVYGFSVQAATVIVSLLSIPFAVFEYRFISYLFKNL